MAGNALILVTVAAGQFGAAGRTVAGLLEWGLPVRAMVLREDDRAAALRAAGAEVVVGDLLEPAARGAPVCPLSVSSPDRIHLA
jgi:NAD(P)H dehydrogenase (quinone)